MKSWFIRNVYKNLEIQLWTYKSPVLWISFDLQEMQKECCCWSRTLFSVHETYFEFLLLLLKDRVSLFMGSLTDLIYLLSCCCCGFHLLREKKVEKKVLNCTAIYKTIGISTIVSVSLIKGKWCIHADVFSLFFEGHNVWVHYNNTNLSLCNNILFLFDDMVALRSFLMLGKL